MLQVGETVRYGQTGLCRIVEMRQMEMGGETREYFVLTPLAKEGDFLFVPADNEDLVGKMLPPLTEKEWESVFADVRAMEADWIRDFRRRSDFSKKALNSGDRREPLFLIKNILLHRKEITTEGKRIHTTDDYFLKDAETLIFNEISFVLGKAFSQVKEEALKILNIE